MKVRTALSRPCPARQTVNRQRFFKPGQSTDSGLHRDRNSPERQISDNIFTKFRTESRQTEPGQTKSGQTDAGQKNRTDSGQQTDIGHDFSANPENETRIAHE